jgi:L-ribulokinase
MLVAGSPQTPALGSAVSAAVTAGKAAGGYDSWEDAQDRMTSVKEKTFTPNPEAHVVYDVLYGIYRELHDAFGLPAGASAKAGGVTAARGDLASIMKRLLALKEGSAVAGV